MIDVSELITDPDFAQPFTARYVDVTVATDGEAAGEVIHGAPNDVPMIGPVQPMSAEQRLDVLPEGERDNDAIRVWSLDYIGDANFILWNGRQWKVMAHKDWRSNGYWWCVGVDSPNAVT